MKLIQGTPIEDYNAQWGLFVKREDLCCPGGPNFSKTRGVWAHLARRRPRVVGVLDTYHSQAGHAVARAAEDLGIPCVNFYPEYKHEPGVRPPQLRARDHGAELVGLPAGRSAVLYHQAKKRLAQMYASAYMMPNALKLEEMVEETRKEVVATWSERPGILAAAKRVILPSSSATIAAGVISGFRVLGLDPEFYIHLGYSRSVEQVWKHVRDYNPGLSANVLVIDEGYAYKDQARRGPTPQWPCNPYYDLKAFRWFQANRERFEGPTLFWNIG